MTRVFYASVIPAMAAAAIAYFGYYTVWGTRGLLALSDTNARLAVESEQLSSLTAQRQKLQHRIRLLAPGHEDPDLIGEVAHDQLLGSTAGEIAIPRKHP